MDPPVSGQVRTRTYLVWVCQQQDLCDGCRREDGVESRELGARWRLQLHCHRLQGIKYKISKCKSQIQLVFSQQDTKAVSFVCADLWSCGLQVYVGDGGGGRGQHGDDHHQHIRTSWRRVAGEVKENPQTVFVKHGHR